MEKYFLAKKELIDNIENETFKKAASNLLDAAHNYYRRLNHLSEKEKSEALKVADVLLKKLFNKTYTFDIPYSFIESEIGEIIFTLRFGINQMYYTMTDAMIIFDKTRVGVTGNKEKLKAKKIENKAFIIEEQDLIEYMKKYKFMSSEEIDIKLSTYKENLDFFKNQDVSISDKKLFYNQKVKDKFEKQRQYK